jgi:serine/threonine protein kinase
MDGQAHDTVVLKFLHVPTEDSAKYFERERQTMSRMCHPATLPLRGFALPSTTHPDALIVMDFMPNGSLKEMNDKCYALTAPPEWNATAKSKAAIGIAAAMHYVHSLKTGIRHRNLKPENILLDSNFEVRISDFERSTVQRPTQMTLAQDLSLTCAPEAYEQAVYTNKVGVFSHAIVLYSMFRKADTLDDGQPIGTSLIRFSRRMTAGTRLPRAAEIPEWYWEMIR